MPRGERPISPLIFAELYDTGDAAFVEHLIQLQGDLKNIRGVIEKWKKDRSAWARKMKLAFVTSNRINASHRMIFKRLFKQAWHDNDHELMGACMAVADRWIRRRPEKKHIRDRNWRLIRTDDVLRVDRKLSDELFSVPTAHYLRRRAWRYFRKLGLRSPDAYPTAVAGALVRYEDDDVQKGENLLDCWGLMHACFGKSVVLKFSSRHTNLATGQRLSELQAAPMFERLWAAPEGFAILLKVLLDAQCRPVRVWSIQLLKRLHDKALLSIDATLLLRLIEHTDTDVAAFAATLLNDAHIAASLPVTTWLALLATRNPTVVASIVEAFRKHVDFGRLTLAQAVQLATLKATPVARLGIEIAQTRPIRSDEDRTTTAQLAQARCDAAAGDIATFALKHLNVAGHYRLDNIVPFFDSALLSMREASFAAVSDESPAGTDPGLWAALLESPYHDVRIQLIDRLKRRQSLPGASANSLAILWQSVLLNIHKGGRAKLTALQQISRQITLEPHSAITLLPVVAVAIRSVRPPEARHGLAAIVSAAQQVPEIAEAVGKYLPELVLDPMGAVR